MPEFYRFADNVIVPNSRPFNGLLAFIPQPERPGPEFKTPQHAAYENSDLQWLEIKDHIPSGKLHLELLADSPRFWLVFQMAGSSEIYLPHPILQSEGRHFGFGSKRTRIPLALAAGSVWLLIIACKSHLLPLLAEEFGQLDGIQGLTDDAAPIDVMLPDQTIDYTQRRRLQTLEKMEYKAFATPVLLSEWLLRTLQYIYKPLQTPTHGEINLYHEALRYIRANYLGDINKASIARALHVSTRTLNRVFENRPIKIGDFIHTLKLNKARELLYTTDKHIEEISRELNFSCPKHFSNRYKQHFFESPTEFRLQNKYPSDGENG